MEQSQPIHRIQPQIPVKPKKKTHKKVAAAVLVVLIILLVGIAGAGLYVSSLVRPVMDQAKVVLSVAREAGVAVKSQDIAKAKDSIKNTKTALTELDTRYAALRPFSSFPFAGAYVADGDHAIKAGFAAIDAGQKAIDALEPNADLLGLKGKSSFVSGSAEQRLQMAVKTLGALTPSFKQMAGSIDTVRKELSLIDPNRYPEEFQGRKIRSEMVTAFSLIDNAATLFVTAQPLLERLPEILGDPTYRRYLVLFQNDKELRPTGGFLSAYARFGMDKGKPILEKSGNIYDLDDSLKKKFPATEEISTYHKGVYQLYIRDSNLSPDFKVSMAKFLEMYQTSSEKEKIDGIIAVDTHVFVETLRILGPMVIDGRTFSAEIDKRCDCAKAIYELEDETTRPVNYVKTDRKAIIGRLMKAMMDFALGTSPKLYWGPLIQMLGREISQKHVVVYMMDPVVQKAMEDFNLAGRIMTDNEVAAVMKYKQDGSWDYVHINNSNMAGAKSNMFVSTKVTKDTTKESGGTIKTKLTVEYKNPYEGSDCNLERGGLCLNAPLRNWVRVYVPTGSTLVENIGTISPKTGKTEAMTTKTALGKTYFEGFLIVNPMGTAKLVVTYTSPVKADAKYKLLIQKQPGTDGEQWLLKLDGKDRKSFPLVGDTEVEL